MANTQTATRKSVERLQRDLGDIEPAEMGRGGYDACARPQSDAKGHAAQATATVSLGRHGNRRRA